MSEAAAKRALELRVLRRTRSGTRPRSWRDIADILAIEGFGRFTAVELAHAAAGVEGIHQPGPRRWGSA